MCLSFYLSCFGNQRKSIFKLIWILINKFLYENLYYKFDREINYNDLIKKLFIYF